MISCALINSDNVVFNVVVFDTLDSVENFDFGSLGEDIRGVPLEEGSPVTFDWTYVDGEFYPPVQPPPTKEELMYQAEQQRQLLLKNANDVFISWQTKLLLNRATEDEKKSLNDWLDYFEALKALNLDDAPDVAWPEQPPIPEGAQ